MRPARPQSDGIEKQDRLRPPAPGRSQTAPSRHLQGSATAWLGTKDRFGKWSANVAGLFSECGCGRNWCAAITTRCSWSQPPQNQSTAAHHAVHLWYSGETAHPSHSWDVKLSLRRLVATSFRECGPRFQPSNPLRRPTAFRDNIRPGSGRSNDNSAAPGFPSGKPQPPDGKHNVFVRGDCWGHRAAAPRLPHHCPSGLAFSRARWSILHPRQDGWIVPPLLLAKAIAVSERRSDSFATTPAESAAKSAARPRTECRRVRSSLAKLPGRRVARLPSVPAIETENKLCRSAAVFCRSSPPYRLPPDRPALPSLVPLRRSRWSLEYARQRGPCDAYLGRAHSARRAGCLTHARKKLVCTARNSPQGKISPGCSLARRPLPLPASYHSIGKNASPAVRK